MIGIIDKFGAGNETRTRDPNLGKIEPRSLQARDSKGFSSKKRDSLLSYLSLRKSVTYLSIFPKLFLSILLFLSPIAVSACDSGWYSFIGIGYDFGSIRYQKQTDMWGDPYRDPVQAIAGFEYLDCRHGIRYQAMHSSDVVNGFWVSYGDLNMISVQKRFKLF